MVESMVLSRSRSKGMPPATLLSKEHAWDSPHRFSISRVWAVCGFCILRMSA